MAGGAGRVISGGGRRGGVASVVNNRLLVDAIVSGGGGGGGNVTIVAPLPVPVDVQVSIPLSVNVLTLPEPVSVDDNGGSLTVDGTVVVSSITNPVALVEPVSIDDNGSSITVDGTIAVSTLPTPVPVTDNGGSLTVDGTVAVSGVGGTVVVGDGGGSLTVDGTVAVSSVTTSITPGTGSTNLGKAEDAAHANGHVGVMALAVRNDTASALATTNGDYIPFTTDSLGRLWVRMSDTILPLSSSTNGQPIALTGAGFQTLHTVAANSVDEITLYASNITALDITIILGVGGVATGQQMYSFLPAHETVVVGNEIVLNAGQVLSANLTGAGTVRIIGKVTRRST